MAESIPTRPSSSYTCYQIKPFRDNDFGAGHRESFLKNFNSVEEKIYCSIVGNNYALKLYCFIPQKIVSYFQNVFYASFPTSSLVLQEEFSMPKVSHHLEFGAKDIIATRDTFAKEGSYMDPLREVFSLYETIDKESSLSIVYSYQFKKKLSDREKFVARFKKLFSGKSKVEEKADSDEASKKEDSLLKQNLKPQLSMGMGFSLTTNDPVLPASTLTNVVSVFHIFSPEGSVKIGKKPSRIKVSRNQASNFFHLPTTVNFVKGLDYTVYRKLPYPSNLPTMVDSNSFFEKDITVIARTDYRGDIHTFGIKEEDKYRHMYVVWKTGSGKSVFLSNMVKADMLAGKGLALIDPHGDLIETVLEHIPSYRTNDVILFDVGDQDFPMGFNMLQYSTPEEKQRVVSGVVSTFKKLFSESRGPRLEYILRNALLSLVDYPNATLLHLLRLLTDKTFKEEVVSHIKDHTVLKFWRDEFDRRQDKQQQEAIAPITNKVGQFLSSPIVRNIFGQPKAKLNIRKAMDESKILLINLSKGRIGEDNAAFIGSLLVTKFQIDAMSRADIPMSQRKGFFLYIDEFQNFATESFATILSEARKYRLSLIMANQYTSQLMPEIKDAIFGNVGTIITFTLGYDDALIISSQFKDMVSPNDLISLPRFTAYTKLHIDGITCDPFSVKTIPLPTPDTAAETVLKIKAQSRQRYAMAREETEGLIQARAAKSFSAQEKMVEKVKLNSLGFSDRQIEFYQSPAGQTRVHLFKRYLLNGVMPDAIAFDTENEEHQAFRYTKPTDLPPLIQQEEYNWLPIYNYPDHPNQNGVPLVVIFWAPETITPYLQDKLADQQRRVFMPRILPEQIATPPAGPMRPPVVPDAPKSTSSAGASTPSAPKSNPTAMVASSWFTVNDIKLWQEYDGYVKLSYNYGIFVTVKGVEWLLHKNFIKAPDGVDRKKYYNIGDSIKVTAQEFKDVNGEKRVVWVQ